MCYIRGSVIPCFISLSCRNPQALDMITAANCIDVRLQRTVGYSCAPGIEKKKVSYQESVREFAKAVWSPSATMQSDPCNRHLEGEIRIPKDLKPTSLMDHFSVSVRCTSFYCIHTLLTLHVLSTLSYYARLMSPDSDLQTQRFCFLNRSTLSPPMLGLGQ